MDQIKARWRKETRFSWVSQPHLGYVVFLKSTKRTGATPRYSVSRVVAARKHTTQQFPQIIQFEGHNFIDSLQEAMDIGQHILRHRNTAGFIPRPVKMSKRDKHLKRVKAWKHLLDVPTPSRAGSRKHAQLVSRKRS